MTRFQKLILLILALIFVAVVALVALTALRPSTTPAATMSSSELTALWITQMAPEVEAFQTSIPVTLTAIASS